ncbi:MAG: SLC13 family permease [Proteobacteria bacterium]|nr:SLC13 family permease [Pseudomonadota bacterium]
MTFDQILMLCLLGVVLGLFIWGKLRHDVVAILALLGATLAGHVSMSGAFAGFANPATVTVALVLIVSRGLVNSGAVNIIARRLLPPLKSPTAHVGAVTGVAGALSAFMNNVGALALLMPAALQSAAKAARSPSVLLMPLAFGSILGGLVTLIGTPPNIIIASIREQMTGQPFTMFDFSPVGGAVAVTGIAFVALIGWRLIPHDLTSRTTASELFEIENYITEAKIPADHELIGRELRELDALVREQDAVILGITSGDRRIDPAARRRRLRVDDVLLIEAGPDALNATLSVLKLRPPTPEANSADAADPNTGETEQIAGSRPKLLGSPDVAIAEAVVQPRSRLTGRTADELRLRSRFGVNLLAVARQGMPSRGRLGTFRFQAGDILLLEGEPDRLGEIIGALGCLPLAERSIQGSKIHMAWLSMAIFGAAIAATGLMSFPIALAIAVVAMVLINIVPVRELYDGIDWSIVVLLGAMIPVGQAMQNTGTTTVIAEGISALVGEYPAAVALTIVLVLTITLSDIINNAATAVVMAPIAVGVANQQGVNPDCFLMAVAIGASCAFLTPIGHQNNALIMGPGGYRFGDYWRMGLPLEILIVAVAIPMLLWVWPLS